MDHATLAARVKAVALLEGDFTLRSGKKSRFYFDKYLFETQPDILAELGKQIAARLPQGTTRIAGPELGAVALAAAGSLWKGGENAAEALKLTSKHLKELGVIDEIIEEPLGAAHRNTRAAADNVEKYIDKSLRELKRLPVEKLVDKRYDRLRKLGSDAVTV